MNNHNTEMFWVCCLVVALALTQVVNLQLDTSPGQWKTFTATSYYRRNTSCKLEDGYAFTYPGQNLEIGENGEIQEFEGWFHISYLNPMGE